MRRKTSLKQTQFNTCLTGVNPQRTHGFGIYKGRRKVWGVRVDETLLKQAKRVLRAKFGSDCRGVETWLAGLVATAKGNELLGVNPRNTVEIGKLVIERNLRSRRKLVIEETEENERVVLSKCYVDMCGAFAVGKAEYLPTGDVHNCCRLHLEKVKVNPKWKVVA